METKMKVEIWQLEGCPRCEEAFKALLFRGANIGVRDLAALKNGTEPDVDAMAQLAVQNYVAPLICVEGRFLDKAEIDGLLDEKNSAGA